MNHQDHVDLLREGVTMPGGAWADLGCGSGAFTLALAELLGPQAAVYAVDVSPSAVQEVELRVRRRFPACDIQTRIADFTRPLDLPPLEGIVMANSLHFHREKAPIIRSLREMLRESGRFILVEYDVDRGNPWVPFPVSWRVWQALAPRCGFAHTEKIGTRPSSFLREIYSAVSF